jgi:DNA-binding NarL/FixJ family response regulator
MLGHRPRRKQRRFDPRSHTKISLADINTANIHIADNIMAELLHLQRTLLVIDDTVDNLRVAVDLLHAYGFRVLTASNGKDGIERAALAQPDLILLDIRMPGFDGFETCRRLKAHPQTARIPVLFMTALTDTDNKIRGFDLGAVDYVTKPFDSSELLARVRTHLELNDLRLRLEERVADRTAALAEEVARRKQSQEEQALLLDLLRQQGEQLRAVTRQTLEDAAQQPPNLANQMEALRIVLTQIESRLAAAESEPVQPTVTELRQQLTHAFGLLDAVTMTQSDVSSSTQESQRGLIRLREDPLFKLTMREYEVLQLIGQGKSNAQIAEILIVSRSTVSSYRSRIMQKLGVPDTPALLRYIVERQVDGASQG